MRQDGQNWTVCNILWSNKWTWLKRANWLLVTSVLSESECAKRHTFMPFNKAFASKQKLPQKRWSSHLKGEMLITQKPCSVKDVIKRVFLIKKNTNKKKRKSFIHTERKSEGFLKLILVYALLFVNLVKYSPSCLCIINVEENGLTGFSYYN